jgi:hypothetical protein
MVVPIQNQNECEQIVVLVNKRQVVSDASSCGQNLISKFQLKNTSILNPIFHNVLSHCFNYAAYLEQQRVEISNENSTLSLIQKIFSVTSMHHF